MYVGGSALPLLLHHHPQLGILSQASPEPPNARSSGKFAWLSPTIDSTKHGFTVSKKSQRSRFPRIVMLRVLDQLPFDQKDPYSPPWKWGTMRDILGEGVIDFWQVPHGVNKHVLVEGEKAVCLLFLFPLSRAIQHSALLYSRKRIILPRPEYALLKKRVADLQTRDTCTAFRLCL